MRCAAIITSLAVLLAMAGAAGAATLNVGPGQTYTTIQAAIDAAAPDDIIQVAAGTYAEAISITKRLTVQGAGAGTTIIDGASATITVSINNTGGSVTVSGFTVKPKAVTSETFGIEVKNVASGTVTIQNCVIQGSGNPDNMEYGIYIHGNSASTVFSANTISATGDNPILVECNPGAVDISDNHLDAGSWGLDPIFSMTHNNMTISSLQKVSNNVIDLSTGSGTDNITGVTFISAFYRVGSETPGAHGLGKYTNILIEGNTITGLGTQRRGISVLNEAPGDGTGGEITGVIIRGNTVVASSADSLFGIRLSGLISNASVTGNRVVGAGMGFFGRVGYGGDHYPQGTLLNNNSFTGNTTGVDWPAAAPLLNAENNWWGAANGPSGAGGGSGDPVSANVDFTPWRGTPYQNNVVYLVPTPESLYVNLSDTVIVDMNVANLTQRVLGLQAMLNFSSTYFKAGEGEVSVTAGGGVWDELIWGQWTTDGDLDVAVGVHLGLTAGTQADAKTAYLTLQPKAEGVTKVVFRTDHPTDDTKQTFFTDTAGNVVWPGAKLDTVDIYIDGTGPTAVTLSADKTCTKDNVELTFSASDATSGVDHFELFVDGTSKGTVTSPYTLNLGEGEYAEGAHPIKVRAYDKSGNTTDSADVTVNKDTTVPSITCPADVTVNTDAGSCAATSVALGTPTASDTCSAVTVTNDAPSSFNKGTTTVTWTATDAAGNFASCTQTVTVNDAENPTITCPGDVTVSTDAGVCYATGVALGTPTYSDNCPGSTVSNSAPAQFPKGDTIVTWTVTDASGNTATCTQKVTVNDTEAPTITCPANVTVNTDAGLCYATGVALGTPSTGDNCAVASVINDAPAQFAKGDTTVTWTVTDTSGNTATCTQTVTVTDIEAPVVTLNGQAVIHLQCPSDTYTEPGATATDNCDTVSVAITGTVDEDNEGVYIITYTATDAAGNIGTQTRTVYVEGAALTVNVPGPLALECEGGGGFAKTDSRIAAFLSAATASDGCENDATITNDAPDFFPIAVTTVTWTATDPDGGTATGTQTVTVTDGTAPVITGCPTDITQLADPGVCGAVVTWTAPTASDICGDVTLTSDHDPGDTFPVGTTSVTYTATDEQANTTTCSFTVTVTDNQAPSIAGCPTDIAVSTDTGACTAVVTWTAPTASDNCLVSSFTSNKASGDAFDKGITTVTYTALDAAGNSATCSFTVTVTDNEKPTITCPANKVVGTDVDKCGATGVDLGTPVTADNCGVASVTNNAPSLFPTGDTIVTWTVTDTSGNTETCTQTVTVNDTVPPSITCPSDVTVNADSGSCQASGVVLGTPSTGDNCAVASVVSDAPASFAVGETTVTWTVTDGSSITATCPQKVTVLDNQAPTIAISSAQQNAQELIGTSTVAVQGVVQIAVTAGDNCILLGHPSVTVTPSSGSAEEATFVNENPTGTFNYTWTVTSSTANGTATINASVTDASANTTPATVKTFTVNKNQAVGTVSFGTWSAVAYSFTRDVVFVATDNASPNVVLKTWTVSVAFTNSAQVASGSYTLTDVPAGTAHVSAKTAWHLRRRVDVDLGGTGQIAPSFTLLGGDLNNSNSVNILDYSKMVTSWGGGMAGDINGDGFTGTLDYSIMKSNWFKAGDSQ